MESLYVRPGQMTAHQVAESLGVTLAGVRQLVRRGKLTRVGGTPRQPWYDSAAVAALYRERHPLDSRSARV